MYQTLALAKAEVECDPANPLIAFDPYSSPDTRRDYTRLDREVWTATLADDNDTFQELVAPLGKWLDATPSRVPLTDWYNTIIGNHKNCNHKNKARSGVGGIFIRSLRRSGLGHERD